MVHNTKLLEKVWSDFAATPSGGPAAASKAWDACGLSIRSLSPPIHLKPAVEHTKQGDQYVGQDGHTQPEAQRPALVPSRSAVHLLHPGTLQTMAQVAQMRVQQLIGDC
jgi:hypothetical protein